MNSNVKLLISTRWGKYGSSLFLGILTHNQQQIMQQFNIKKETRGK